MKIAFHGACEEVTGSCHLVDTGTSRFLVDCGIFQGHEFAEKKNYDEFDFDPKSIDFLILTHAHADHCGRLPKLVEAGFKGRIYATPPTKGFTEIILRDSARLIREESKAHGHDPLYPESAVPKVLKRFETFAYHQEIKITPEITATFFDAGHILGSAFVKIVIGKGSQKYTIVFSGDLGNPPVPLLRDTEFIDGADAVVIESTYGGRTHEPAPQRKEMLKHYIKQTIDRGGTLMIPTFALERTQELLYELNHLAENKEIPLVPVYLDSPLAIKATNIYKQFDDLYDDESKKLMATGDDLFYFPKLRFTETSRESKGINKNDQAKIIIAGSGMITGGRMLHHLKRYLPNKKNQLLIIGYQAEGTLGRKLLEGAKSVTIDDRRVSVKAPVNAIGAYSAHADQPKLLNWLKHIAKPKPQHIFLVHGEVEESGRLKESAKEVLNLESTIARKQTLYDL